ncbi:Leucine Rich Repeat family protein [Aphelenchoides avenae]|nr:Leucine Rich Repeat family protein [Aphelenchus avenae]
MVEQKADDKTLAAPRLLQLCANAVADNPDLIKCTRQPSSSKVNDELDCSPALPASACEILAKQLVKADPDNAEQVLQPFYDGVRFPLNHMDLTGAKFSDDGFVNLLEAQQHNLRSLDMCNVRGLKAIQTNFQLFDKDLHLHNLSTLKMNKADVLRVPIYPQTAWGRAPRPSAPAPPPLPQISEEDVDGALGGSLRIEMMDEDDDISQKSDVTHDGGGDVPQFTSFLPQLRNLFLLNGIHFDVEDETRNDFLRRVLSPLRHLSTLDLSEWQDIGSGMSCIRPMTNLTKLVLYDVHNLWNCTDAITSLPNLVYLDVSQSDRTTGMYPKPVTALHKITTSLPHLKYLDISGTNLTSPASDQDRPFKGTGTISSDIHGLRCLREPLEFLGVFNCDNASHYQTIPAKKVCGDCGEDQILLALEAYKMRPMVMGSVLNECYQLYRFGNSLRRHVEALHLVLDALDLHLSNSNLQIAGSASMFYIIRHVNMNRDTKRRVIFALLNGMDEHMEEQVMVRNCCLSLCQFEIPQEILFDYGRVAQLLVRVLQTHSSDSLTQRIVVFLLNSMACHVEGDQKIQVGDIGAIEIILEQINRKYASSTCDEVMEVGWSFLWNITDETPVNCQRFLDASGLQLFQVCYQTFPNETELVRNMMGLIGNIAEVKELRGQLMNDNYLNIFRGLLASLADGIEISYNSAGVLAHLVSDGEEAWKVVNMCRDNIMADIIKATEKWDIAARRYINYRSFKPILRLLPMFDSPGSQHWAVWALANLTSTDRGKYCSYVKNEGGEELLQDVYNDARSSPELKRLSKVVLDNIKLWEEDEREGQKNESATQTAMETMD